MLLQQHKARSVGSTARCTAAKDSSRGLLTPNFFFTGLSHQRLSSLSHNWVSVPDNDNTDLFATHPTLNRYYEQGSDGWAHAHKGVLTTGRINMAIGLDFNTAPYHRLSEGSTGAFAALYESLMPETVRDEGEKEEARGCPVSLLQELEDMRGRKHADKLEAHVLQASCDEDWGLDMAARFSICERVAAQGSLAARLFWGNVAEPAALYCVTQVFPFSQLEEVGLLRVPDAERHSGGPSLPHLGCSPDALIRHLLPVTQEQVKAAHAHVLLERAQQAPSGLPAPDSSELSTVEAMKAAAELIAGALESMPLAPSSVPRSAPQRPHHQWPPRSHAAHALRMHSTTPLHVPINQISQGWLAAQICRVGRPEQEELSHRQSPDMSGPPCLATTPDAAHHLPFVDDSGTAWIEWREAVEVKNHCPFVFRSKKGVGGQTKATLSGNRPYRSVQAKWLPQLQLHCLGAETQSTLLVSRTATKGVTIFRVFRNDEYIQNLLAVVGHVSRQVQLGRRASQSMFKERQIKSQHDALLEQTSCLALGAHVLTECRLPFAPGADTNAFFSTSPLMELKKKRKRGS